MSVIADSVRGESQSRGLRGEVQVGRSRAAPGRRRRVPPDRVLVEMPAPVNKELRGGTFVGQGRNPRAVTSGDFLTEIAFM